MQSTNFRRDDYVSSFRSSGAIPGLGPTLQRPRDVLRDAGLIQTEKRGRIVYAKIRVDALRRLTAFFVPETK